MSQRDPMTTRPIAKAVRERAAVACSMMACACAVMPDTTARDVPHVDTAWSQWPVPEWLGLALCEAVKGVDGPHHRFAEMEALLRTGWNPCSPSTGDGGDGNGGG
jgi:hypothetical protein